MALIVISFFSGGGTDNFAVTVNNLYTIFAAVFAYSGFCQLYRALSAKRSPIFVTLLMVMGVLLLSSLALTLLSVYGVIFTIAFNKQRMGTSDQH